MNFVAVDPMKKAQVTNLVKTIELNLAVDPIKKAQVTNLVKIENLVAVVPTEKPKLRIL